MCGVERALKDRALPHSARSLVARSHVKQGGMLFTSDTSEVEKGLYLEESHFILPPVSSRWRRDGKQKRRSDRMAKQYRITAFVRINNAVISSLLHTGIKVWSFSLLAVR